MIAPLLDARCLPFTLGSFPVAQLPRCTPHAHHVRGRWAVASIRSVDSRILRVRLPRCAPGTPPAVWENVYFAYRFYVCSRSFAHLPTYPLPPHMLRIRWVRAFTTRAAFTAPPHRTRAACHHTPVGVHVHTAPFDSRTVTVHLPPHRSVVVAFAPDRLLALPHVYARLDAPHRTPFYLARIAPLLGGYTHPG